MNEINPPAMPMLPPQGNMDRQPNVFICKDTAGVYQEQADIDGTWEDYISGRTPDAIDEIPAGCFAVLATRHGRAARYIRVDSPSRLRPVNLAQTGGSDGDASTSTPCSYTYTVTDAVTEVELATAVAPEGNRWVEEGVTPATRGVAWMEGATCHLTVLDEIPGSAPCTPA
jgi:hypothetical protein